MTPYGSEEALESLRESKKRTEQALTPKARVYRRLKGGRPKKLGFDKPTPLQVVNTLFTEIERTKEVMHEEGVDPRDLRWRLYYYARLPRTNEARVHEFSPTRGVKTSTKDAIEFLRQFDEIENPLFIRIQWLLDTSRWVAEGEDEDHPDDNIPYWETKFNAYPLNTAAIAAALEEERKQR
jgi:hypothetical protein